MSVRASVVIPTLNAGAGFRRCLTMVFEQDCPFEFEVIVIDSGSRDDTREIAREFRARVYEIPQREFNHGLTRQRGVALAAGDYVAFLTQDAVPADRRWLASLVKPLEEDERVAGVYSRQLPRANCDPITRRRLEGWLSSAVDGRATAITSRTEYDALSPWEKRLFINFDDVSSCVRKRLMRTFPFAQVPFGEDLEWSQRVLEAGHRIVYEPESRVYHSHPLSILTNYRRARIDHRMLKERLNVDVARQFYRSASDFILNGAKGQIGLDWSAIRQSDLPLLQKLWLAAYAVPLEVGECIGCVRGASSTHWRPGANRTRIALVTHDFPPDHFGGVAVYTYSLAKALSEQQTVSVFYRRWDGTRPDYSVDHGSYEGIPVTVVNHNFAAKPNSLMQYDDVRIDEVFRQFLIRTNPDVVHFQFLGTGLSTGMVRTAKRLGIPTLLTLNDYWLMCPRGQMMNYEWHLCSEIDERACARCVSSLQKPLPIYGGIPLRATDSDLSTASTLASRALSQVRATWREPAAFAGSARRFVASRIPISMKAISRRLVRMRQVLADVDVLLAPSHFLKTMYGRFGIAEERILYADYGLNTSAIEKSLRRPSACLVFGYIGTLLPTKGVHILVDAFLKLPEGQAKLRIYGPPANKYALDYVAAIARKIGDRSDIRLMGAYQPQEIGEVLAKLDVVVVPSIWHENSPLTIHEAFMAGRPVITSNIGGMAELVADGINGLHFKVGDADDLHRKLVQMIEHPALVTILSAATPAIKSIEQDASELEARYAQLIGQTPRHS